MLGGGADAPGEKDEAQRRKDGAQRQKDVDIPADKNFKFYSFI
jgi:hypothetical protein